MLFYEFVKKYTNIHNGRAIKITRTLTTYYGFVFLLI